MKICPLELERVKEIHAKYHADEFPLPDFDKFSTKFQVINETNRIITAGGFRLIPEAILLTNKDASVLDRRIALYDALDQMIFHCEVLGLTGLHAFVKDADWAKRLKRTGFHTIEGEGLVLDIL